MRSWLIPVTVYSTPTKEAEWRGVRLPSLVASMLPPALVNISMNSATASAEDNQISCNWSNKNVTWWELISDMKNIVKTRMAILSEATQQTRYCWVAFLILIKMELLCKIQWFTKGYQSWHGQWISLMLLITWLDTNTKAARLITAFHHRPWLQQDSGVHCCPPCPPAKINEKKMSRGGGGIDNYHMRFFYLIRL